LEMLVDVECKSLYICCRILLVGHNKERSCILFLFVSKL
jgi:hypothetical protein